MTSSNKPQPGNIIMLRPDGPLIARGNIEVRDAGGQLLAKGEDLALCRCGASKTKPFCDGAHQQSGFQDDGQFVDERTEALQDEGQALVIQCRENAMLLAKGPMHITSRDGKSSSTRNKAALCRCGHSTNKPFCDAQHKQYGFKSG